MKDTDIHFPENGQAPNYEAQKLIYFKQLEIESMLIQIMDRLQPTPSVERPNDLLSKTEGQKYIQEKYGLKCGSPNTLKAWCEEFPNVLKPQGKEGLKGVYYARSDFDELALRKQGLL